MVDVIGKSFAPYAMNTVVELQPTSGSPVTKG
jgi:hypothetical protein